LGHIGDKKEGVGGREEVLAQAGLEGGPKMFDGVEVGRVRRQEQQLAARRPPIPFPVLPSMEMEQSH
jgi:hypothetical protein